ncbi:MAG: cellulase family glycosylhydrolase [Bacteroidetes bacterium]|nr:cellulase family glycosylhydrolase [Bacteroidota bacterium]
MRKKSIAGILIIMVLGMHLEGQVGGSLRADMYTIPVAEETGMASARLSWLVENSSESVISIDSSGVESDFITGGDSGTAIAPWIRVGKIHKFRLYAMEGETRTLLDSISVSGTRPLANSSIGLNAFPLFAQYLGISQRNKDYQNERHRKVSRAMARKSIISASEIGATYLRVMASGFFSPTLDVLKNDPEAFWSAMDELVAEFKSNGMKIIPSLGWNIYQFPDYFGETISDFIGDPNSQSYLFYTQFISDFVSRYKDQEVVLFYELGNEYNLHADLSPNHSFNNEPYTGKYSTVQLSDFQKRTANFIRSMDPAGMVTSGNSTPRPSAYHLMLQPAYSAEGPDWTHDSFDEFKEYVKILEEGVDIVSMHMYNGAPGNIYRFGITEENSAEIAGYMKEAVDEAGKLLFLGEFGDRDPHVSVDTNAVFTRNMFDRINELDIPFSAPWIWEFYQFNTYEKNDFTIEQGFTDLLIEKYKEANVNLGNKAVALSDPDTVKPQVVLTFPIGAEEFSRPSQVVHAVASDNSGSIVKVEFYVNGELANTDSEPPYQFDLNTGGLSMNSTEIVARAYDQGGNTTDYMLEANPEIETPMGTLTANPDTVRVFSENSGGHMVGSVTLSWSASGVENVFLYVKMDQNETKLVAQGSANSSQSVGWIQDGHAYVFYLSSVADDLTPLALLDTVLVIGQKETDPLTVAGFASRPCISNYPNPFQNRTLIRVEGLEAASATSARMEIFDILGNLREMVPLDGHTGVYEFSREGYASGLYYCRLVSKGKTLAVHKLILK